MLCHFSLTFPPCIDAQIENISYCMHRFDKRSLFTKTKVSKTQKKKQFQKFFYCLKVMKSFEKTFLKLIFYNMKWPPSLSELTLIVFTMELTHLGSKATI